MCACPLASGRTENSEAATSRDELCLFVSLLAEYARRLIFASGFTLFFLSECSTHMGFPSENGDFVEFIQLLASVPKNSIAESIRESSPPLFFPV